ncbi:uncharacterized protein BDR25DRAFT_95977 [Lindgomyces ingoldianus]|uniref:Uncharacterized protein n=1 Tax=Lindgomyces ingoldianus TaxID=673940 RepID=A0ACB6QCQ2_9PLEO|nr:uncharacterized protein BDR25DRAFT_95977 [Lindgomyces ingoldianus]KAF2464640.1 hypothetical protein BDR25DRAFT_95977 [Lindgomyces ingoldianus]
MLTRPPFILYRPTTPAVTATKPTSYYLLRCHVSQRRALSTAQAMASASRLNRLRELVSSDLQALPDKFVENDHGPVSDDDTTGGVSLSLSGGPPPYKQSEPTRRVSQPGRPELTQQVSTTQSSGNTQGTSTSSIPSVPHLANPERQFVWMQDQASSWNLGSQPNLSSFATTKLPAPRLQKGTLASARQEYTPIFALAKYPYKFCNKNFKQDIATHFFDAGKFWAREWDLYYVWDLDEIKPLILVHEEQFQTLLKEINLLLRLGLKITDEQRNNGLVSPFPEHPRCTPRYLGRSHSRQQFDDMVEAVPSPSFRAPGEKISPPLEKRTLEYFKQQMEELLDLQRAKGKAQKLKKKQERIIKQQNMGMQFKRAQRYLGLRLAKKNGPNLPGNVDLTWEEPRKSEEEGAGKLSITSINASLPVPFPFEKDVVIVSVDVESYERDHNKITEVGIATLDTRDLNGVAPGKDGEAWRSKIRARHLRIYEHRHLNNVEFVSGCAGNFEFGDSEFVRLDEVSEVIATCFKPPFCNHRKENDSEKSIAELMQKIDLSEQRNLIFLGHDPTGDIRYLNQLGFKAMDLPNMLETLDTASLYRVWKREPNPTKLGNILYDFDTVAWNLHNAGNDAVYTVHAMLAICVREATIRGSPTAESIREASKAARLAALTEEARVRAQEEMEGWSDGDNDDGGEPVKILLNEKSGQDPKKSDNQHQHQSNKTRQHNTSPNMFPDTHGQGQHQEGVRLTSYDGSVGPNERGHHRGRGSGPRGAGSINRASHQSPDTGRRGRSRGRYSGPSRPRSARYYTNRRPASDGGTPNQFGHAYDPTECHDLIDHY